MTKSKERCFAWETLLKATGHPVTPYKIVNDPLNNGIKIIKPIKEKKK